MTVGTFKICAKLLSMGHPEDGRTEKESAEMWKNATDASIKAHEMEVKSLEDLDKNGDISKQSGSETDYLLAGSAGDQSTSDAGTGAGSGNSYGNPYAGSETDYLLAGSAGDQSASDAGAGSGNP